MPPLREVERRSSNAARSNGTIEAVPVPENSIYKRLTGADNIRLAEFVLSQQGSYFPSAQTLHSVIANEQVPNTLAKAEEKLKAVNESHLKDLQKLYAIQAEEYGQEALDRYLSVDSETGYWAKGGDDPLPSESHAEHERLYRVTRLPWQTENSWSASVSRLRQAHLLAVQPLHKRRAALAAQDNAELRRRKAQFPASKEEWRAAEPGLQRRVANFLMLDASGKEKVMSRWGWAWRQVKPLCDDYDKDSNFAAEVQAKAKEIEVQDPRRRHSGTTC